MAQQQGSPPEKRSNRCLWVYLAIVGVLLVALARVAATRDGQVAGAERTPTPTRAPVARTPTPRPTTAEVSFLISGSAFGAHITYSDGRGGIHQTSQKLPWEKTITVPLGMPVSISAQNTTAQGAVACRISVNGITAVTATADTAYGIASCSTLVR